MVLVHGRALRKRKNSTSAGAHHRGRPWSQPCGLKRMVGDRVNYADMASLFAELDSERLLQAGAGGLRFDRGRERSPGANGFNLYPTIVREIRALVFRPHPQTMATV